MFYQFRDLKQEKPCASRVSIKPLKMRFIRQLSKIVYSRLETMLQLLHPEERIQQF